MADNTIVRSVRSVGNVGGTVLLVVAAAAAVMTAAVVLMVLAIGGGAAAVTAATGVGLMETIAESEWELPQTDSKPPSPTPVSEAI